MSRGPRFNYRRRKNENFSSKRRIQVWTLFAEGYPAKEISAMLGITLKTVSYHKCWITNYFNIRRNDAMFYRLAVAFGLVDKQKPIQ